MLSWLPAPARPVRTVERDIARLTAAGVPAQVKRGPGGGYQVNARRDLPPITLSPGEAAALVASIVAIGPDTSASARGALDKLLAALARQADADPRPDNDARHHAAGTIDPRASARPVRAGPHLREFRHHVA